MGGELCAHGGRGQREWTIHEYYGMVVVVGVYEVERWQYIWDMERVGGGVGDGIARECMCTRTHEHIEGHSSDSNRQRPHRGLCCSPLCMYSGENCREAIVVEDPWRPLGSCWDRSSPFFWTFLHPNMQKIFSLMQQKSSVNQKRPK